MHTFTKETVSKLIGQPIILQTQDDQAFELKVKSVGDCTLNGDEWESFYVDLQNDGSTRFAQGTYNLSHTSFGQQQLFLSPKSETDYEIIVNRKR